MLGADWAGQNKKLRSNLPVIGAVVGMKIYVVIGANAQFIKSERKKYTRSL